MEVLLVDDEKNLLEQAKIYLEKINDDFKIDTSTSAEKGLEKLEENTYDAIVSDYKMPDMNGLEFLELIRQEKDKDIPFIMFTGKGREEVAMKALNLGADRYLQKGGEPESQYVVLSDAICNEVKLYQTDKALREREEQLNRIFESSPDSIIITDLCGRIIDCNKATVDLFNTSKRDEILGRSVFDFFFEEISKEEMKKWDENLKEGSIHNEEYEIIKPDGSVFPAEISVGIIKNDRGEPTGFVGIVRDLTKRKKAKKELKKLKEEYEAIFNNVQNSVFLIDVDDGEFRYRRFNPRHEKSTGLNTDELKGKTPDDAFEKEFSKEVKENYKECLEKKEPITYEEELDLPAGKKTWLTKLAPIEDDGDVKKIVGAALDITDQKETERRLKRAVDILEKSPTVAFTWKNEEGWPVEYVSENVENVFGYTADEFISGDISYEECVHPDDMDRVEKEVEFYSSKSGREEFDHEPYRIITKEGDIKVLKDWTSIVRNSEGEITHYEGIIQDITEKKNVENELQKRNEKIKKLHEKATEFEKCESEEKICELVLDTSEKILDFEVCGIDFVEQGEFVPIVVSSEIEDGFIRRKVEESGISKKAYREKKSLLVKDSREVDFSKPVVSEYRASITIPMGDFGIYQALSTEVDAYDEKDLELAEILVNHATEAINRLRFKKELKSRKKKVERLQKASAELESCQDEDEIYSLALGAAEEILDFDICGFDAVEDGNFVVKATSSGVPDEGSIDRPVEEGGIDRKTYQEQRSFLIEEVKEDEGAKPVRSDYRSAISVPIGEFGVFQAVSTNVGHFEEEDLKMAELLMDHVAEALKRLEVRKREDFLHSLLRHDVKNKGQIVKGYLDLMEDYDLPEDIEEYLEKAMKATEEGMDVIEKVRKLRKIQEKDEISEVNIDSVVDQVLSEHSDQLDEQGIEVEVDKPGCMVEGGPLLKELFSNLVENSIRHSGCGKIKILSRNEGGRCVVLVEDDGIGLSDDIKEKIFNKGFRKGDNAGSGLGMYMVKKIADFYGDGIEVYDSEMGGVKFEVKLRKFG